MRGTESLERAARSGLETCSAEDLRKLSADLEVIKGQAHSRAVTLGRLRSNLHAAAYGEPCRDDLVRLLTAAAAPRRLRGKGDGAGFASMFNSTWKAKFAKHWQERANRTQRMGQNRHRRTALAAALRGIGQT